MTQQSTTAAPAIGLALPSAPFEAMLLRPEADRAQAIGEAQAPAFFRGLTIALSASALFWIAVAVIV